MDFSFVSPTRIIFGAGMLAQAGELASELGQRPLVVVGQSVSRARGLLDILQQAGLSSVIFGVNGEPTTDIVRQALQRAVETRCDMVISMGGGSVLDAGKAIAALMTNNGDPLDYLEVIGAGKPITNQPLPFIAIPTTAGTGAEVTKNAVLISPEHSIKVSLRSPMTVPPLAILDPALTCSMPRAVTASTGLDALTQVIEPFVSNKANPITDALCRDGMRLAARSLRIAYAEPDNLQAREDMMLASLFGGLALANAKLGAVHGFAGPLGGMFPAPHGMICARLLPFVMASNVAAIKTLDNEQLLARFDEVAQILTGQPDAVAQDGVDWIRVLCADLEVPTLSAFGLTRQSIPDVVQKAAKASSMQGNPVQLSTAALTTILTDAL